MKVYRNLLELKTNADARLVNIGNFDGVHQGHQSLIHYLKDKAKLNDLKLCLYTFLPHPRIYFEGIENFLLTTLEKKISLLSGLGVDELLVLDFNTVAKLTAQEFLKEYVEEADSIKALYLGYDFRFGKDKKGDFILANNFFKDSMMNVSKAPKFEHSDQTVSSSLIREKIIMGEMKEANLLMGRPYEIKGKIIHGKGKGKQIGVPTANLELDPLYLTPLKGVYISTMRIEGKKIPGVTNIGINPTFGRLNKSSIETHLLNFNDDLYGKEVELCFHDFIRPEKKFAHVDQLIKQIYSDINTAKDYHQL